MTRHLIYEIKNRYFNVIYGRSFCFLLLHFYLIKNKLLCRKKVIGEQLKFMIENDYVCEKYE